jgi:hypothetical protein
LGDIVSGIGGGKARNDADPYNDGTETPLRLLSRRSVGEEAGRVNGRPVNLAGLDQVTNLGTDSVPDTIQRGVEDSAKRFDGDMGVSAHGLGEGRSEEVRTVHKFRVVAVSSDAVIIAHPLVLVGAMPRDNCGIAGEGEGGEIGRHGGRLWSGAGQAGRAGVFALLTLEVDALKGEHEQERANRRVLDGRW